MSVAPGSFFGRHCDAAVARPLPVEVAFALNAGGGSDASTGIHALEHFPLGVPGGRRVAVFIIALFGFIYWKTDDYLTRDPTA